ncbi:MAG TPA: hypothetical protein VNL69_11500 [Bacteroidota bacterium]|nr:hypothetical protein [Bacteroidota bacterium]
MENNRRVAKGEILQRQFTGRNQKKQLLGGVQFLTREKLASDNRYLLRSTIWSVRIGEHLEQRVVHGVDFPLALV